MLLECANFCLARDEVVRHCWGCGDGLWKVEGRVRILFGRSFGRVCWVVRRLTDRLCLGSHVGESRMEMGIRRLLVVVLELVEDEVCVEWAWMIGAKIQYLRDWWCIRSLRCRFGHMLVWKGLLNWLYLPLRSRLRRVVLHSQRGRRWRRLRRIVSRTDTVISWGSEHCCGPRTFVLSHISFECSAYFSTTGRILEVTMRCARLKL